jgi:hypothetical protein
MRCAWVSDVHTLGWNYHQGLWLTLAVMGKSGLLQLTHGLGHR